MSWIDCINPFNNPVRHGFYRHIPSDKRFNENDKAKICPVCWFEAQKRNGTLPISNGIPKNHRPESKPERDSL